MYRDISKNFSNQKKHDQIAKLANINDINLETIMEIETSKITNVFSPEKSISQMAEAIADNMENERDRKYLNTKLTNIVKQIESGKASNEKVKNNIDEMITEVTKSENIAFNKLSEKPKQKDFEMFLRLDSTNVQLKLLKEEITKAKENKPINTTEQKLEPPKPQEPKLEPPRKLINLKGLSSQLDPPKVSTNQPMVLRSGKELKTVKKETYFDILYNIEHFNEYKDKDTYILDFIEKYDNSVKYGIDKDLQNRIYNIFRTVDFSKLKDETIFKLLPFMDDDDLKPIHKAMKYFDEYNNKRIKPDRKKVVTNKLSEILPLIKESDKEYHDFVATNIGYQEGPESDTEGQSYAEEEKKQEIMNDPLTNKEDADKFLKTIFHDKGQYKNQLKKTETKALIKRLNDEKEYNADVTRKLYWIAGSLKEDDENRIKIIKSLKKNLDKMPDRSIKDKIKQLK